ncbi:MAG: HAMP domain-containing histidine kinase, partial [Bdellovibrionales bacterium]|nr:HAMP domain-containing histidine kinase [Bdellovibrionales bacterium]
LKAGGILDDYVLRDIRTGVWITSSLPDPAEILHPGFSFSHGSLAWVSAQTLSQGTEALAELTLRRGIPLSSILAGPLVFAFLWFPIDRLIRRQLRRFSQRLVIPIQEFSSALQRIDALGETEIEGVRRLNLEFSELAEVQGSFCSMFDAVRVAEERAREFQTENRLGKMARQVAHDVRSPLAALKMAVEHLEKSPALASEIIHSATDRITAIARDLTERKESTLAHLSASPPLVGVVEPIVSEKELQHRRNVFFTLSLSESFERASALMPETALQRILSNVIDNAVEAIDGKGTVSVNGSLEHGAEAVLSIRDTGKGIPQNVLPRLMQKGATFGKPSGSGLGLFHARETLEKVGGSIEIQSKSGEGTCVTIRIPALVVPSELAPQRRAVSSPPPTIRPLARGGADFRGQESLQSVRSE